MPVPKKHEVLLLPEGESPSGFVFLRSSLVGIAATDNPPIPVFRDFGYPAGEQVVGYVSDIVLKMDGLYGVMTFIAPFQKIADSLEAAGLSVKPELSVAFKGKTRVNWPKIVDDVEVITSIKMVGWE